MKGLFSLLDSKLQNKQIIFNSRISHILSVLKHLKIIVGLPNNFLDVLSYLEAMKVNTVKNTRRQYWTEHKLHKIFSTNTYKEKEGQDQC